MQAGTYDHIWNPIGTQEGWLARLRRALRTRAYGVLSDETLVQRALAGDHTAFDALVARYRNRLHTMALDFLGNEDEANHALCEMVLAAFKDIGSFRENCTPGTWLYLRGFRAVFKHMNAPRHQYMVESRPASCVDDV